MADIVKYISQICHAHIVLGYRHMQILALVWDGLMLLDAKDTVLELFEHELSSQNLLRCDD